MRYLASWLVQLAYTGPPRRPRVIATDIGGVWTFTRASDGTYVERKVR